MVCLQRKTALLMKPRALSRKDDLASGQLRCVKACRRIPASSERDADVCPCKTAYVLPLDLGCNSRNPSAHSVCPSLSQEACVHFFSLSFADPKIAFLIPHANPPSCLSCLPASWKSFAIARLIAVSLSASAASCSCWRCSLGCCFTNAGSISSRRACSFTSSGWRVLYTMWCC